MQPGNNLSQQKPPDLLRQLNNLFDFNNARTWWFFYAAAVLSFLPALGFYYVGEEAIHPIVALEMWYRGEWLQQPLYGLYLKRNPLFHWLVIFFANFFGWEHVLSVARAITISATVLTGIIAGWLARKLYRDNAFAAFTALIYLTLEDVFFYRGWLAYVDPLFALLVFSSIACLWVATLEKRAGLLWLGTIALFGAFMTKALTAYAFYFVTVMVMAFRQENLRFFLRPGSLLPHLLAVAAPVLWLTWVTGGGQQSIMVSEILLKFSPDSLPAYAKQLLTFPFLILAHLLPWSLVILYWARGRHLNPIASESPQLTTAFWIIGLNFIPYWIAPHSHPRYILPLHPLFALILAYLMWGLGDQVKTLAMRVFVAVLALKLIFVIVAFPYYQRHYRGENYEVAAREILHRTEGHQLYSSYFGSSGLNVTAYLDIFRLPQAPLTFPPAQWESGFVLAHTPDPALGRIAEQYRLGAENLYLLCRGSACSTGNDNNSWSSKPFNSR